MLQWLFPLPQDISAWGHEIDWLFWLVVYLTGFAFVLVMAILLYSLVAYRERPGHKAYYTHGDQRPHAILTTLVSVIVFLGLDFQVERNSRRFFEMLIENYPRSENVLRIEVRAEQFAWNFRYPGPDGIFGNRDDVVDTTLHLPADRPVILAITSKDVIHSLFLPNLRVKQDAVPGVVTSMWFKARETGATKNGKAVKATYEVACAELCGNGHTRMRSQMHVYPADTDEFDLYLAALYAEDEDNDGGEEPEENWGWHWQSVPFGGTQPKAWADKAKDASKVEGEHH